MLAIYYRTLYLDHSFTQENDIESQLFPDGRRHSASAFTRSPPLNTSNDLQTDAHSPQLEDSIISSDSALSSPLSSSLGSAGEGGAGNHSISSNKVKFDYETMDKQRQLSLANGASTDTTTSPSISFNASFGGFSHSGAPVAMKNAFPQPTLALSSRRHSQLTQGQGREPYKGDEMLARCRQASVSSTDSQGSSHTTTSIKFSDLNEIDDLEQRYAELLVGSVDT